MYGNNCVVIFLLRKKLSADVAVLIASVVRFGRSLSMKLCSKDNTYVIHGHCSSGLPLLSVAGLCLHMGLAATK